MHLKFLIIIFLILITIKSVTIKSLNSSCLCDISNKCDNKCCCDSDCPTQLITKLTNYNICNKNGFGIPFCSSMSFTDVSKSNLYSGLQTIYTIVKRLFCLQRINIVDPTSYYNTSLSESIRNYTISSLQSVKSSLKTQPSNIASLSTTTINGILYRDEIGRCVTTNTIKQNIGTDGYQQCRVYLSSTTNINTNQYLSVNSIVNNFANISIYLMSQSTKINPTQVASNVSSSCPTSTSCTNIVRYIKLYINPDTQKVIQSLSYIIIGDLDNIATPSYIIIKYSYQYLNNDNTFINPSNIGYNIGTLLQLIKSNGNKYYKVINPINLAFRKSTGQCRVTDTDTVDQSIVQLRLGRNQMFTCIGTNSLILQNIKNAFDYIGTMGASYDKLVDFVPVTWPTSTSQDSNNILLTIYYSKVGASVNPQYQIVKAVATTNSTTANQKVLFIQYQQIDNTASMYIPPPPNLNLYLPNDFLYPFYVAQ